MCRTRLVLVRLKQTQSKVPAYAGRKHVGLFSFHLFLFFFLHIFSHLLSLSLSRSFISRNLNLILFYFIRLGFDLISYWLGGGDEPCRNHYIQSASPATKIVSHREKASPAIMTRLIGWLGHVGSTPPQRTRWFPGIQLSMILSLVHPLALLSRTSRVWRWRKPDKVLY